MLSSRMPIGIIKLIKAKMAVTNIKKRIKPDYTVITVLMLLVYWFHYDFLVVDYYWCLLIGLACIIYTAILWPIAFYAAKKKIDIETCIKMVISLYLFCWVMIYSYGYFVQSKKEKQTYVVPLSGYYTRRIDGILYSILKGINSTENIIYRNLLINMVKGY